ncbi:hypothetical protein PC120_g16112 [Phytophthora cactorum]|nr:hypothetical protein PC120_g16112 [Phytophthora cactorum]
MTSCPLRENEEPYSPSGKRRSWPWSVHGFPIGWFAWLANPSVGSLSSPVLRGSTSGSTNSRGAVLTDDEQA